MSKYIYAVFAFAFLALAGIGAWEHQEVKRLSAERDLAAHDRDLFIEVASANAVAVTKLRNALNTCDSQLKIFTENAQDAATQHEAAIVELDKQLKMARAKSA
jgi:hypothetical protein